MAEPARLGSMSRHVFCGPGGPRFSAGITGGLKAWGQEKACRVWETTVTVLLEHESPAPGLAAIRLKRKGLKPQAAVSAEKLGLRGALFSQLCHGFFDFLFAQ